MKRSNVRRLTLVEQCASAYMQRSQSLHIHNEMMAAGCIECRSAIHGRVCPDCYTCLACGTGCVECASMRGFNE